MSNNLSSFSQASKEGIPILKIFESLPGLYLILSPDLIIQAVSDAYLRETLTEREKILGKNIYEAFPEKPDEPDTRGNLYASLRQVLSSRKPHTMAIQHYHVPDPDRGGSYVVRYRRPTNTPVLNEQGEVIYLIHEVVNVTETKKTEQQELESRSREQLALGKAEHQRACMERFLMQVPAMIAIHDGPEFIFEFINPVYQQVFPERKLLGKPLFQGLPELAGTPTEQIIRQVYKTGETYEGREILISLAEYEGGPLRNGYYNLIYQARHNQHGAVDGILVFAYDVSEQVKARKVIEGNVGHLHLMANAMPQKVWTAAANGEVDYFNEKWLEYTGLSFDDLKGWGWKKIIHPDDWEENEKLWLNSIETGKDFQVEHRFRGKDGEYRWHLTRGMAQRKEDESISIWIGTDTDIHDQKLTLQSLNALTTELTTTNQQLVRINQDLDNFIYTASHDLRAPITNIEGLVQLLKQKLPRENDQLEKVQPIIGMMQTSVERFKNTVHILTDITRLQKDADHTVSHIRIPEMTEEVMLDLAQLKNETGAQIDIDVKECAFITFSEKNLRSILYNLLSNAIKYHSPERTPQVHISCKLISGYAVLKVRDNGLGIDLGRKEKLFSMFMRLHNHVEGSGIGLFMVKRMVENAGGKIEVESTLGEGSTFSVYFKQ